MFRPTGSSAQIIQLGIAIGVTAREASPNTHCPIHREDQDERTNMKRLRYIGVAVLIAGPLIVQTNQGAHAAGGGRLISAGSVTLSSLTGTAGSDVIANPEFHAEEGDEGDAPEPTPGPAPRVRNAQVNAAGAEVGLTFQGINHRDQRLARNGTQFSLEPPDQALCVGPDHVVESVNDALRVYTKDGVPVTPTLALSQFFGYPPSFVRPAGPFGPFITDPVCHFDADSGRFFVAALTLDQDPNSGDFTGKNRLDLAVSTSSDPTKAWNLYKLAVQDDGTDGTPDHHCAPAPPPVPPDPTAVPPSNPTACIGDFPHIGTDAYGVYLTTNEYSFFGPGYSGAQIYAISKVQLLEGDPSPTTVAFESPKLGPFKSFTVWPAISPAGQAESGNGGTEYFLSSTLGDGSETGNFAPSENRIGVWAITNTSSIDSASPNLRLSNKLIKAAKYTIPPKATQKDGPTPLRDCLNDTAMFGVGCGPGFLGFPTAVPPEVLSQLDSSDTRMMQVVFTGGQLFGALGTGVQVGGSTRAGVLWVTVQPQVDKGKLKKAKVEDSGYVGVSNNDVIYPAIGVSSGGKVVMAATLSGNDHYPSAAYVVINDERPTVTVISEGVGPTDGFSGYRTFGDPPRPRWGDYGALAMDGDTLWVASESIEQSCALAQYVATGGSCGGTRTALANWSTRVTKLNI
jgi:hypothetical protein